MSQNRFTFNDDERIRINYSQPQSPRMVHWIIKHSGGYVKNAEQANYVLIGIVLLSLLTSVFLSLDFSPPPEEYFIILPGETVGSQQGLPK